MAEKCGAADVARDLGIEIVDFEPVEVSHPDGKHFKHFTIGKAVLEADKIINLPKFKTHGLTLLTLAVKNIFGCIPGARKAQWHVRTSQGGSEYFSKMLLDLYSFINPVLSIVDGIVAMEGKGPGFGTPRDLGLIVAGTDAVAVDSVISEVLGVTPEKFPTLKIALSEHYGTPHLSNIDVRGEPVNEVKVDDYQFPPKITEIKGFLIFVSSSLILITPILSTLSNISNILFNELSFLFLISTWLVSPRTINLQSLPILVSNVLELSSVTFCISSAIIMQSSRLDPLIYARGTGLIMSWVTNEVSVLLRIIFSMLI